MIYAILLACCIASTCCVYLSRRLCLELGKEREVTILVDEDGKAVSVIIPEDVGFETKTLSKEGGQLVWLPEGHIVKSIKVNDLEANP